MFNENNIGSLKDHKFLKFFCSASGVAGQALGPKNIGEGIIKNLNTHESVVPNLGSVDPLAAGEKVSGSP